MASRDAAAAEEEILQAVIIGDSYNSRFKPLTNDLPRCLLPLANTPLIEYTLEFLAASDVRQVYIFVCAHADKIKDYLANSRWSGPSSPFKVVPIVTPESLSLGDAMRELDAKQLITSDFILLTGDVVSNVSAEDVVAAHRRRRETSKDSIMTMVLREVAPLHRARPATDSAVFVIDSSSQECIHYEPVRLAPRTKRIHIDGDKLARHDDVEVRNDLVDCNIDICSADVPALFTENFDYQHIRRDFVHGILTSDLLGKQIHCHIEREQYAAKVGSLQAYDAVSRDVISRWTFPLSPDANLLDDQDYGYHRPHVYRESGVKLARSAVLKSHCVIGRGVRVGDRSVLSHCTIGRHCTIGSGATIDSAYIWSNAEIGNNCRISRAVIGDGCDIGDGCVIERGVVLGADVWLAPGTILRGDIKLCRDQDDPELADEALVGAGGKGVAFEGSEDEDEEEDEYDTDDDEEVKAARVANQSIVQQLSSLTYKETALGFSDTDISAIGSESESESDDDDQHLGAPPQGQLGRDRLNSSATMASVLSEDFDDDEAARAANFFRLARQDLDAAFAERHSVDDTMLEMTSLRMREDVSMSSVRKAILDAALRECIRACHEKVAALTSTGKAVPAAKQIAAMCVRQWLNTWTALLARTVSKSTRREDAVDLLLSLQAVCAREVPADKADAGVTPAQTVADLKKPDMFLDMVRFMYEDDLLTEEDIFAWYLTKSRNGPLGTRGDAIRRRATPFVTWLQEAEEEDDSDEDDDSLLTEPHDT